MTDTEDLLSLAADADYWDFAIRLGEGVEPDEGAPNISARCFNTVVHFVAPTDDKPAWRLAERRWTPNSLTACAPLVRCGRRR
jgi:hypothetical protein